jgi:signal peptidase I
MTTFLPFAAIAARSAIRWILFVVFLRWGARWAKIPNTTWQRTVVASVAAMLINLICSMLLFLPTNPTQEQTAIIAVLDCVLILGLTWLVIAWIFRTSPWRAVWAWTPTLIPAAGVVLLTHLLIRPYLYEPFIISLNSMAPTALGVHLEAPCPRCGSPAFCSPDPEYWPPSSHPYTMICSKELRSCKVTNPPPTRHSADRVLVNKQLRPQRWDIVVFHHPVDSERFYCKRLIGLPGETVVLRDGAVWIDGRRQSLPDSSAGLEYLADPGQFHGVSTLWGSAEHPAKLGADEYYVLGDFSANAQDSRLWTEGAPGHPPYAVPASYIVGVATHIYWPPARWRTLR